MNLDNKKIVTRFAPSPTGTLHVGGVRTALFNYLFARKHGGTFILRIEDTDKERSKKEFEDSILDALTWLGITWDSFYRQSERTELYKKHLQDLLAKGAVYISHEEPKEAGERSEVIRFKNPNTTITFDDQVLGSISFDTRDLGDFVIAKDLETPLYHLAVVVDDFEMGVTHVIRGQEHISNTPRQILIQEALGAPRPIYAHIPLILAPDKSKLSKRHGAVSATEYREQGYLPQTIINFLALIGWNPGTDTELFSLAELTELFDIARVQKGGGVFNAEKLNWLNKEYLKRLSPEDLGKEIEKYLPPEVRTLPLFSADTLRRVAPLLIERVSTLGELRTLLTDGEFSYFFAPPSYEPALLKTPQFLSATLEQIEQVPKESFTAESVKSALWDYATKEGRGNVLWPLRIALSGKEKSPDPFTIAAFLGKEETCNRIRHAIGATE